MREVGKSSRWRRKQEPDWATIWVIGEILNFTDSLRFVFSESLHLL